MTPRVSPSTQQGQLLDITPLIRRGVKLVRESQTWRNEDKAGYDGAIDLICKMEDFIRDWLAAHDDYEKRETAHGSDKHPTVAEYAKALEVINRQRQQIAALEGRDNLEAQP